MKSTRPSAIFVAEMAVFAWVMILGWWALFQNIEFPALSSPRSNRPSLTGSLVTLSSEAAGRLLAEMGTFLHSSHGGESGRLTGELDPFDLASIRPLYIPLEQVPRKWLPLAISSEPLPVPELMPFRVNSPRPLSYPPAVTGFFVQMSDDLRAASFSFKQPSFDELGVVEGESVFYVEVDADGRVDALWRLKTEATALPALERELRRGHAARSCRGEVRISWNRASAAR